MEETTELRPKMIATGVPNLDLVLGGGLQQHNSYIIAGPDGAGKSVLSQQIAFHRAKQGERVLLITGLDEPHHNLLEHLKSLRFVDFALVGPQIETVSMVPFLGQPQDEQMNILRKTVLNVRPQLVTLDGLRSFEAFAGGPEGMHQFLYGLTSWFAVEGITLLLTKDTGADGICDAPEYGLVDGVWLLRHDLVDGRATRRLWIQKMRGQQPLDGPHSFDLDADGVRVWPRPQATFHLEDRPWHETRLGMGVPALDSMLGGGLQEATSTLLAGGPGTGKTILGLSYLHEGVRQGQAGLWLGWRESRSRLLAISSQRQSDLSEAESRGQIHFLTMAPFDLNLDRLADTIQGKVTEMGARRVVLDAAETLTDALPARHEAAAFVAWLVQSLGQQGVTTLITQRGPSSTGLRFDGSGLPLALLVDNLIVARQIEQDGQLRRAMAVIKMSTPGYEPAIREYSLDQYGMTMGEPLRRESEVGEPAPRASREPARGPI